MKLIESCGHVPTPSPAKFANRDHNGQYIVITAMCKRCFLTHVNKDKQHTTVVDPFNLMNEEDIKRMNELGFAGHTTDPHVRSSRADWFDLLGGKDD